MRPLPILVVVAALAFTALPPHSAPADSAEEDVPLVDSMQRINGAYRTLGRGLLRTPDAARVNDYLEAAETIFKETTKAIEFVPTRAMKLPEAEKQAMIEAFQADMTKTAETAKKLVETLKGGDLEAGAALVRELREQRNAGHEKYQEEEESAEEES